MEQEAFFSGYCRQLDQTRMVTVVAEDGEVTEVDCCFGNCIYEPNCVIAQKIKDLVNN